VLTKTAQHSYRYQVELCSALAATLGTRDTPTGKKFLNTLHFQQKR